MRPGTGGHRHSRTIADATLQPARPAHLTYRTYPDTGRTRTAQTVGFHPNVNTATITLAFADFERFLAAQGNRVQYLQFT